MINYINKIVLQIVTEKIESVLDYLMILTQIWKAACKNCHLKVRCDCIFSFSSFSWLLHRHPLLQLCHHLQVQPPLHHQKGVNFINVFTHSFYAPRSRKCKKLLKLTDFFALLGSACVKAESEHVDEIDPISVVKVCLITTSGKRGTANGFGKKIQLVKQLINERVK